MKIASLYFFLQNKQVTSVSFDPDRDFPSIPNLAIFVRECMRRYNETDHTSKCDYVECFIDTGYHVQRILTVNERLYTYAHITTFEDYMPSHPNMDKIAIQNIFDLQEILH